MNISANEKKIRKRETFKRLINLCLVGICLALEIAVFAYHWEADFKPSLVWELRDLWVKANVAEIALYGTILIFLSATYGGMRLGYQKNAEIIFSQVLSTFLANIIIYLQLSIMAHQLFVLNMFIVMMVKQTAIVLVYINVVNYLYKHIFPPRKLLLIHGNRPTKDLCGKFESRKDKYAVTRKAHIDEGYEKICRIIEESISTGECTAVVLGDISTAQRDPLLKYCYGRSIRVYLLPKISDVILMGAEELHVFDSPMLLTREYSLSMEQRFFKRTIDIVCSLILLILASPIMLITAIVIKLYDRGPVLYKQIRCTVDQREFYIMKFRSMRTDAEKDGVARLAQKNDDRITPIGKFICRGPETK